MRIRAVVKGALTFIPGLQRFLPKPLAGQHARPSYYYGVWLKHLAILHKNGLYNQPTAVAELGPGDSLALGFAALLTGADRYYGLDIVAHTDPERNLEVLDRLVEFFEERAPRPTKGWPDFDDLLDERLFPSNVLTDAVLSAALAPERVERIRQALRDPQGTCESITAAYRVPWNEAEVVESNSIDLVISQAVLEHVSDIGATYRALYKWLKPGGVMSHQIDFRSHELTRKWNGHRAISEPMWKVMTGRRPYLINREPWSAHEQALGDAGFEVACVMKLRRDDGIDRSDLSKRWRDLSDDDLNCAEVLIQARKRH